MTETDQFQNEFLQAAADYGCDAGDARLCCDGALQFVSEKAHQLVNVSRIANRKERKRTFLHYRAALSERIYSFLPALPWWALIARFALQRFVSWAVEWILERWASRPEALVLMARGQ